MLRFSGAKTVLILTVVLIGLLAAAPGIMPHGVLRHWPAWLPRTQLRLATELAGGTTVVLEADRDAFRRDYLIRLRKDILDRLHETGVKTAHVIVDDGHLVARFTKAEERDTAFPVLDDAYNTWAATRVRLEPVGEVSIRLTVPAHTLEDAMERSLDRAVEF